MALTCFNMNLNLTWLCSRMGDAHILTSFTEEWWKGTPVDLEIFELELDTMSCFFLSFPFLSICVDRYLDSRFLKHLIIVNHYMIPLFFSVQFQKNGMLWNTWEPFHLIFIMGPPVRRQIPGLCCRCLRCPEGAAWEDWKAVSINGTLWMVENSKL